MVAAVGGMVLAETWGMHLRGVSADGELPTIHEAASWLEEGLVEGGSSGSRGEYGNVGEFSGSGGKNRTHDTLRAWGQEDSGESCNAENKR